MYLDNKIPKPIFSRYYQNNVESIFLKIVFYSEYFWKSYLEEYLIILREETEYSV